MLLQFPVAGSYSSALLKLTRLLPNPPATSTLPDCSSVAVWILRAVPMLPVVTQLGSISTG